MMEGYYIIMGFCGQTANFVKLNSTKTTVFLLVLLRLAKLKVCETRPCYKMLACKFENLVELTTFVGVIFSCYVLHYR